MSFKVEIDDDFFERADNKIIQAKAIASMLMVDGFNQEQSEGHYNSHGTIRDAIWCLQELIKESGELLHQGIDIAREKVYEPIEKRTNGEVSALS